MPSSRRGAEADRAAALGTRIRQLRRERGLTQRALAERVPMSAANLSRIENGEQGPPSEETIARLAKVLNADQGELLRLAGRAAGGPNFEEAVLVELEELRAEVRSGFERLESAVARGLSSKD